VSQKAQIKISSLKVTLPLKPDQLPTDLVPPDGPPGEPILELHLDPGTIIVARVNGKNYRRMLKTVSEHSPDQVVIILQGNLKPGIKSGTLQLESAGFSVQVKTPKPAEPGLPAPGQES
jgi:hypothetical protein